MGSALTRILFDGTDGLKPSRFWTLMAIAHFVNDQQALKTGEGSCWPTVDTIAKKAHLSPNIVRDSIKDLVDEKVLRFEQPAGGRRTFYVRVADLKRVAGVSTTAPLADVTGVTDVKPLADVTGDPLQICEGTPCRSVTTPLSDLKPEQRREQRKEQEKGTKKVGRASAPAPADDLFGGELKEEPKPKRTRRKPETPCPWEEGSKVPEDLRDWCRENCPSLDPQAEFDLFVGHAHTHDRRCKDWKAAYRMWCRKSAQRKQSTSAPGLIHRTSTGLVREKTQEERQANGGYAASYKRALERWRNPKVASA